jgi:hypothetical protein
MPIGFLTAAARDRLNRVPAPIPDDDLSAFCLLSEADHTAINHDREAHTRRGFALQLCALRDRGLAPDDLRTAPAAVIEEVAPQLGVAPQALEADGARRPTRTTHVQQVQAHLHCRMATPRDVYGLQEWLVERALAHDQPMVLLQWACDERRREQRVRPGLTRLERRVATAREPAHRVTWPRLTPRLPPERLACLDALLTPDPSVGRTRVSWLRQEATAPTAPQMLATLENVACRLDRGVHPWDLAGLHPNRVQGLAPLGWRATNQP